MKVDWQDRIDTPPGSPPWFVAFMVLFNHFLISLTRGLRNGMTANDNLAAQIVTLGSRTSLVASGTEYTFSFSTFKPVAFVPSHAVDAQGTPVAITGWKPDLSRTDKRVGVTVTLGSSAIVTGILWGG